MGSLRPQLSKREVSRICQCLLNHHSLVLGQNSFLSNELCSGLVRPSMHLQVLLRDVSHRKSYFGLFRGQQHPGSFLFSIPFIFYILLRPSIEHFLNFSLLQVSTYSLYKNGRTQKTTMGRKHVSSHIYSSRVAYSSRGLTEIFRKATQSHEQL